MRRQYIKDLDFVGFGYVKYQALRSPLMFGVNSRHLYHNERYVIGVL